MTFHENEFECIVVQNIAKVLYQKFRWYLDKCTQENYAEEQKTVTFLAFDNRTTLI